MGGFVFPPVWGYLLESTGLWTMTWVVLSIVILICLFWMHHTVTQIMNEQAPDLANLMELRPELPLNNSINVSGTHKEKIMTEENRNTLATIEHAGLLEDLPELPAYLHSGYFTGEKLPYSCCFCGVGDSGFLTEKKTENKNSYQQGLGKFIAESSVQSYPAKIEDDRLMIYSDQMVTLSSFVRGTMEIEGERFTVRGRYMPTDATGEQWFQLYQQAIKVTDSKIVETTPTTGCVKLKLSLMRQHPMFPVHIEPSRLIKGQLAENKNKREKLSYQAAISDLAD